MRLIMTTVAVLSLAACGAPEQPEGTPPEAPTAAESPTGPEAPAAVVLTAQGIGPLRIGMTRAEVEAAWGADSSANDGVQPVSESCDQFRPAQAPEGVLVMIESDRLTRVSLSTPSTLKTDRGFGVGDEASAIKAAYGPSLKATPHKYSSAPAEYLTTWTTPQAAPYVEDADARGIVYEIGMNGRVERVHAGGPSIQYVEGCA